SRVRRGGLLKPEADEQIAGDTYQLPENEEHDKIIGQDDAEHREGEQTQTGEVTREPAVLAHVTPGVNVNCAGHPGNDEQHQQAQRIEAQAEVHLKLSDTEPVND